MCECMMLDMLQSLCVISVSPHLLVFMVIVRDACRQL